MVALQGTQEWLLERLGKVTSSRIGDVMTKARGGEGISKTALTYMAQLIAEQLTGKPTESPLPPYIADWGHKHEPVARSLYQWMVGLDVRQTGFILHPSIPFVGGSPDSLVGLDGLMEIKCPVNPRVHLETIEAGGCTDDSYMWQCQGNLWVTDRKWIDYVSFHPAFPEDMQLFVKRYERDEDAIDELELKILRFVEHMKLRREGIQAKAEQSVVLFKKASGQEFGLDGSDSDESPF